MRAELTDLTGRIVTKANLYSLLFEDLNEIGEGASVNIKSAGCLLIFHKIMLCIFTGNGKSKTTAVFVLREDM